SPAPRPPLFPYTTLIRSRPPRPAACRALRDLRLWLGDRQRLLRIERPTRPAGTFRGADAGARRRRRGGAAARRGYVTALEYGLRSEEHTSELQSHLNLVC